MWSFRTAAASLALMALAPTVFAQAPTVGAPKAPSVTRVAGKISSVTGGAITVTSRNSGTPVTFTLAPNVRMSLGADMTLSGVLANDVVRVVGKLNAAGTSIDARQIIILPELPRREEKPEQKNSVTGTVTSVSPLQVTLPADPVVVVTVNTQPNTHVRSLITGNPSDLVVGAYVTAALVGPATALVAHNILILPAADAPRPAKRRRGRQTTF